MKKILFLYPLLLSIAVSAQTSKGSFIIGGSGAMSFNKNDWSGSGNTKQITLNFSPDIGYFFLNNLSAGLYLPLELSSSKTKFNSYTAENHGYGHSIGVAPYVRYYIPVKSFFIVTEASYGWYYSKDTYESLDPISGTVLSKEEITTKYKSFSLAAGPAFFLNPYTSIEVLANYQRSNLESMDQSTFFVSVGFQIYIPSRRE